MTRGLKGIKASLILLACICIFAAASCVCAADCDDSMADNQTAMDDLGDTFDDEELEMPAFVSFCGGVDYSQDESDDSQDGSDDSPDDLDATAETPNSNLEKPIAHNSSLTSGANDKTRANTSDSAKTPDSDANQVLINHNPKLANEGQGCPEHARGGQNTCTSTNDVGINDDMIVIGNGIHCNDGIRHSFDDCGQVNPTADIMAISRDDNQTRIINVKGRSLKILSPIGCSPESGAFFLDYNTPDQDTNDISDDFIMNQADFARCDFSNFSDDGFNAGSYADRIDIRDFNLEYSIISDPHLIIEGHNIAEISTPHFLTNSGLTIAFNQRFFDNCLMNDATFYKSVELIDGDVPGLIGKLTDFISNDESAEADSYCANPIDESSGTARDTVKTTSDDGSLESQLENANAFESDIGELDYNAVEVFSTDGACNAAGIALADEGAVPETYDELHTGLVNLKPGAVYNVDIVDCTGNLAKNREINIKASNVLINGNGHSIDAGKYYQYFVIFKGTLNNAAIANLHIQKGAKCWGACCASNKNRHVKCCSRILWLGDRGVMNGCSFIGHSGENGGKTQRAVNGVIYSCYINQNATNGESNLIIGKNGTIGNCIIKDSYSCRYNAICVRNTQTILTLDNCCLNMDDRCPCKIIADNIDENGHSILVGELADNVRVCNLTISLNGGNYESSSPDIFENCYSMMIREAIRIEKNTLPCIGEGTMTIFDVLKINGHESVVKCPFDYIGKIQWAHLKPNGGLAKPACGLNVFAAASKMGGDGRLENMDFHRNGIVCLFHVNGGGALINADALTCIK